MEEKHFNVTSSKMSSPTLQGSRTNRRLGIEWSLVTASAGLREYLFPYLQNGRNHRALPSPQDCWEEPRDLDLKAVCTTTERYLVVVVVVVVSTQQSVMENNHFHFLQEPQPPSTTLFQGNEVTKKLEVLCCPGPEFSPCHPLA